MVYVACYHCHICDHIHIAEFLLQNHVINGVYPVSPASWFVTAAVVIGLFLINIDVSIGFWSYLSAVLQYVLFVMIVIIL